MMYKRKQQGGIIPFRGQAAPLACKSNVASIPAKPQLRVTRWERILLGRVLRHKFSFSCNQTSPLIDRATPCSVTSVAVQATALRGHEQNTKRLQQQLRKAREDKKYGLYRLPAKARFL